ncbi:MAG TPA: Asp-tRNA(Asn)/Glu-tRNA(Gln) amidotransferase subunit GatC [Sediminispirochaeta sp.]|nr:Asp-tRNA(Asn)/Glu-tRNA(Gln) amidotransferase subunit GatC [Sediminispirochaeta sp.]
MDTRELKITASLAGLSLSSEEARELSRQVSRMLEYFEQMNEIDVDSLDPTTHTLSKVNRLREDSEVHGERLSSTADTLLDNAPELEDRFIVIPNVL